MTVYTSRAPFGINPNAGRQRNNAEARGWGPGWPNCQTSKWVKVTNGDHSVVVRKEIAELVLTLFKVTAKYGYDINPRGEVNQTWGAACRAIRGSRTASNHSWALAVDINSLHNPMGTSFRTDMPPKVVHAWETCGFYWGGRYENRPDAMHYEYIGRPEDVARDLAEAKALLNPPVTAPKPPAPKPDVSVSMFCIQRAEVGDPISGQCLYDARQMFSIAGRFNPTVLKTTYPAWIGTINSIRTPADWAKQKPRLHWLFNYVVRTVQAGLGVTQDGIFGPKTAEALRKNRRAGTWTVTK